MTGGDWAEYRREILSRIERNERESRDLWSQYRKLQEKTAEELAEIKAQLRG